jgi:hypothetical protein
VLSSDCTFPTLACLAWSLADVTTQPFPTNFEPSVNALVSSLYCSMGWLLMGSFAHAYGPSTDSSFTALLSRLPAGSSTAGVATGCCGATGAGTAAGKGAGTTAGAAASAGARPRA